MEYRVPYEISGYKITSNAKVIDDLFAITEETNAILKTMYHKVERKKNSAIKELHSLIEIYPNIPQFKNLLSVLYNKQGNRQKSFEINHRLIAEHPDYLFGKLNLANEYIFKKQFDKVPEILGEAMDIKNLYPNRTELHISEAMPFYKTTIHYFIAIEDAASAELRLDILKKLNEEFEIESSDEIEKIEFSIMALRMKKGHEHFLNIRAKAKKVEVIAVKVVEPTREKPTFCNEIIKQLYCNSLHIEHDLLKQILLLPRETLIADLHKVVYDSIARYEYFLNETEWHQNTHNFLTHAIHLLTELKSEESLNVLFDVLRQDEDYLGYWFGDSLNEGTWECFFVLGFNKPDELKNFLFEPNHYSSARWLISEAVSQIALHYPERKYEIINWYKDLIEEILAKKDDEKIIDTDWIAFIINDLLDINAIELKPLIKELFVHGLVSEDVCGSYEDVIEELTSKIIPNDRRKDTFDSIFSRYENIITTLRYYTNEDDLEENIFTGDDETENDDMGDDEYFTDYEVVKERLPIINPNKNIGRNDSCPCGSGKKYKKCCLQN